jgi:hypothetical protein
MARKAIKGPGVEREAAKKALTNSRLYGNFCIERNNRNDRHYKSNAFPSSSEVHFALGRDGHPVGD